MNIELEIKDDGSEVGCSWWTPDVQELFCGLCGKKDSDECQKCHVTNPWCG